MLSPVVENSKHIALKRKEFEELAFQYMDSLYNTALRMTKNELDAEDLVQDVYVRAIRFFHKFNKGTNFKAWIFKILTNTFINQYRKKVNQPHRVDFDKIKSTISDDKINSVPLEQVVEKVDQSKYNLIFSDEVKFALEQVSEEFRMVVVLADIESFSYKEIAQVIGCPVGTVMSRLSRGRKQLQIYLKEYAIRSGYISK